MNAARSVTAAPSGPREAGLVLPRRGSGPACARGDGARLMRSVVQIVSSSAVGAAGQ